MSNYKSKNIKEVMSEITANKIYLPAIQRRFIWGVDRIEKLFDSIMRGYPIGTFLFWDVKEEARDNYTYYRFIKDYHERDNALNEKAASPTLNEFIGVLDGQQRLNSMYVALQGSYSFKRKHGRWDDDSAFPKRELYLNLFFESSDEESDVAYEFDFLTKEEPSVVDVEHFWFKVKDVLNWSDLQPVFAKISEAVAKYPEHTSIFQTRGANLLNLLWQRLCSDDVISYFSVHEQELDKIVDIFVRVNSAGKQLTKTDLLFSSIVAHWDDGREEIENLIKSLNRKGEGFSFDNDFVMRSCLVLTDLPVLFKVKTFKRKNIDTIKDDWSKIKKSLEVMVDLLVEWGFSSENLPALNSVIPIAYFAYKGGDVNSSKADLRQYLIRTLLNQIFVSNTDRVLGQLRDQVRVKQADGTWHLKDKNFSLSEMVKVKLPKDRSLKITDADIDALLTTKKGPQTFMLLSLLYPHLKLDAIKFHQDHIHPHSKFTPAELKKLGLNLDQIEKWQDDRDKLPNLQLMEGLVNVSKNATAFEVWLDAKHPQGTTGRASFETQNFIPAGESLKLEDFEKFYEARNDLLKAELKKVLSI